VRVSDTWKPIEDADAFRVGSPVAAPIGQQLVRNYDSTVRNRVYQHGGRVWFYGHSEESELTDAAARGVQVSSHPLIWYRIASLMVSCRWVASEPDSWRFRLHLSGEVKRNDVLLYVAPAGEIPRVDPSNGAPLVSPGRMRTLTSADDAWSFDFSVGDLLTTKTQTEAGAFYEVSVWMLSRETEASEEIEISYASADGFTVATGDLDPSSELLKPHRALANLTRDAGATQGPDVFLADQQGVYHVLQAAPQINGPGMGNILGDTRLVLWPPLTGALRDRITTAAASFAPVSALYIELSYLQLYAMHHEVVPRALVGSSPEQLGATWWCAAQDPYLWEDLAGTEPARLYDTVRRIDDLSGDGRNLLRAGTVALIRAEDAGIRNFTSALSAGVLSSAPDATLDANAVRTWEWWERAPTTTIVNTSNIFGCVIVPGNSTARRSGVRREWAGTAETMTYRIYNDGTGGGGSVMATVPTPRGSLRHVVVVYDVSASAPQPWTLYVNGAVVATGTATRTPMSETDYRIAHQMLPASADSFFYGSRFLGSALYLTALTADDVHRLFVSRWYRYV
jgi:hypothetical protein